MNKELIAAADKQQQLRKILIQSFASSRERNSTYSIRAFAKRLNISPAALSQILNGKRKVSIKTASKIFDRLNISPQELENLNANSGARSPKTTYMQLAMDNYHLISDWHYFAILSLAEIPKFEGKPQFIAKRLNISEKTAQEAVTRLLRLKLLKKSPFGKLIPTGESFSTSSDIPMSALRKSHFDNLELAKKSLEIDPVEVRDFSSMTMAIDPKLIPEAKKMIKNFRRQITDLLESGAKQEVYKLNVQLFPLSIKEDLK